uniref:Nonstructural protein 1 n=1 Tax=Phylloscopus proregulus parvoviridae sp. TaxID=2794532 RepID=A0A8A4XEI6_9VIRU|nr:MAG: nonstructural protein 1 [Phylloscopus proregulus parvoviridae sp.]
MKNKSVLMLSRYLLQQESENGRRTASDEEVEEIIAQQLDADEKVFISRYPSLCQAFDSGLYEFVERRGFWIDGVPCRASGVPAGVGYLVARAIAGRVIGLVQEAKRNAIIHSGTVRFNEFEEIKESLDSTKRNSVCRIILISIHKDHAHVLHDCPLSHGSCKCFSGFVPKRRSAHKHFISQLSKARLAKIIFYFFNNEKWIYQFKIGEARFTSTISAAAQANRLGIGGGEGAESGGVLESCDDEIGLLLESEYAGDSEGDVSISGSNKGQRMGRAAKRKAEAKSLADIIFGKLKLIHCAPLKEFAKSSSWFDDELLRNMKATKDEVSVAFDRVVNFFNDITLRELEVFYQVQTVDCEEDERFHFGCYNKKRFRDYYYPKSESLVWLKKMLIWQYARESITDTGQVIDKNWKDPVYKFVKWFILFLDTKTGKKNCMYLISSPNAGKTLFMDCVTHYFAAFANLKKWNRSTGFPLEELDGARIAIWNEPNVCIADNREDLLKMLGGNAVSVSVKYKRSSTVQNTPIIVTANKYEFPSDDAFKERITYHQWTQCDILIDIGKRRLHPFALDLLFRECENYMEEKIRV